MDSEIGPRRLMVTLTDEEALQEPPPRRTLCPNYEECLEYAASRFWTSFTCRGCHMEALILAGKVQELPPPKMENEGLLLALIFGTPKEGVPLFN
ncbi:MAG: hypothetical protein AB1512_21060 [Thermodesulfobacteriota bacterium]